MQHILKIPVRIAFFVVAACCCWMEMAADWLIGARARTEYVREGKCLRCGRCCNCLALSMPAWVARRDGLIRLFIWWHSFAMNFRYVAEESNWLIYRCGYYRERDGGRGGCAIYPFRHRLCRFFPRQRLYGHPELHEGCGYRFVRRDAIERRSQRGRRSFDELLKGREIRGS